MLRMRKKRREDDKEEHAVEQEIEDDDKEDGTGEEDDDDVQDAHVDATEVTPNIHRIHQQNIRVQAAFLRSYMGSQFHFNCSRSGRTLRWRFGAGRSK